MAKGSEKGWTIRILADATHRLIGGKRTGELIGQVCLATETGCDAADIRHTTHPQPTLGESVGMAPEVYQGVCADLPAMNKK